MTESDITIEIIEEETPLINNATPSSPSLDHTVGMRNALTASRANIFPIDLNGLLAERKQLAETIDKTQQCLLPSGTTICAIIFLSIAWISITAIYITDRLKSFSSDYNDDDQTYYYLRARKESFFSAGIGLTLSIAILFETTRQIINCRKQRQLDQVNDEISQVYELPSPTSCQR